MNGFRFYFLLQNIQRAGDMKEENIFMNHVADILKLQEDLNLRFRKIK